jgi:hypothetical protein
VIAAAESLDVLLDDALAHGRARISFVPFRRSLSSRNRVRYIVSGAAGDGAGGAGGRSEFQMSRMYGHEPFARR